MRLGHLSAMRQPQSIFMTLCAIQCSDAMAGRQSHLFFAIALYNWVLRLFEQSRAEEHDCVACVRACALRMDWQQVDGGCNVPVTLQRRPNRRRRLSSRIYLYFCFFVLCCWLFGNLFLLLWSVAEILFLFFSGCLIEANKTHFSNWPSADIQYSVHTIFGARCANRTSNKRYEDTRPEEANDQNVKRSSRYAEIIALPDWWPLLNRYMRVHGDGDPSEQKQAHT